MTLCGLLYVNLAGRNFVRMKKQFIVIIVLVCLLVFSIGYIFFEKHTQAREEARAVLFGQGMQFGYEQAVSSIAQMASRCEPVPLTVQNETLFVVSTHCLQQEGR